MSADPSTYPQEESERLDAATDQAIAACDGDMRSTIRALILEFLESELRANTSKGYRRGYAHERCKTCAGLCGVRAMNDIASDLKERFDYASYFFMSVWEHDPETKIVGDTIVRDKDKEDAENQMIDTFEKLCDSVDAIPPSIISKTEELRATIGPGKYEALLIEAIQNVGRTSLPKDATEFLDLLNLTLDAVSAQKVSL